MNLRAAAAAAAIAVGVAVAMPAQATSASPSLGPMKFPVTVDATVPANGHTGISSPTLPATATAVQIKLSDDLEAAAEDALVAVLPGLSNKNRLLTCAALGANNLTSIAETAWDASELKPGFSTLRAAALMNTCFQMVEYLARTFPVTRATTSAYRSGCTQTLVAVSVKVTRSSSGYTVTPTGVGSLPRRGPLAIGCTASPDGIDVAVKARGKKKLAKVVGPSLGFGVVNLSTSAGSPISVTFGVPR